MQFFICGFNEINKLVRENGVNKVLCLLDVNPTTHYDFSRSVETTWIRMDDLEIPNQDGNNPPSETHVVELTHFIKNLKPDDKVAFHCFAGISRSSAAALIAAYCVTGDIGTAETAVLQCRPFASPNRLFCLIADKTLGTESMFYDAAQRICHLNGNDALTNHKQM